MFLNFKYNLRESTARFKLGTFVEKVHSNKQFGYRFGFGYGLPRFGSVSVVIPSVRFGFGCNLPRFGSVSVTFSSVRFGCGCEKILSVRFRLL